MTSYSIDKNFAANKVLLDPERTIAGWLAKNRGYVPGTNPAVDITGLVRWRLNKQYAVPAPVVGLVRMPGGLKSGVDPTTLFTEYAHYTAAATVDPNVAIVKAKTSGAAYDAATTGNFRRVSMSLTLPNDSNTQRRAAYIAPGIKVVGMTQNNGVNLDAVQVEIAQAGATAPTAYSPARALQVGVRPNRLNWGWSKGTTGWALSTPTGGAWSSGSTPTVVSSGAPDDNGAFLRGTISTASTTPSGGFAFGSSASNVIPVLAGVPWSFRSLLRLSRAGTIQYLVRWYNDSAGQVGGNTTTVNVTLPTNTWVEARLDGAVPPAGATRAFLSAYLTTASGNWAIGDTMDVAGVLIEQAAKAGTFFDGLSGADYLFETGGAAPGTRSYYYEDYAVRQYLLKQVLAENCPLGVIPAVPQFAVQPRF